jgi:hypothetical protein
MVAVRVLHCVCVLGLTAPASVRSGHRGQFPVDLRGLEARGAGGLEAEAGLQ